MPETSQERRQEAADAVFQDYDFGWQVVDASGWEYTIPGDEWSRPVYFENEDDPDGPSIAGTFTVRFDGADRVVEAWGNVRGEIVGNPGYDLAEPPNPRLG